MDSGEILHLLWGAAVGNGGKVWHPQSDIGSNKSFRIAAISKKFKPEDVDRLYKEVQEFLEQPEVKDSLEQLEVSKQRLEAVIQVLGGVEDENDPRIEKILVAEAKDLIPPDVPLLASTSVPIPTATVPQTTRVEAEQANTSLLSRMKLWMWRSFFATANDYRKAHQNVCDRIQDAEQLFSVLGTTMDAGQIGAGAVAGAEAGSPGGFLGAVAGGVIGGAVVKIKISTTQYLLGKAISKGEDSFADLARQCAVGDEQKAEFETTARFLFSTAVLGASAAGMVKSGFHGASKLKTTVLSYKTLGLKKGYNWLDFGIKFEDHVATTKYVPQDRLPKYFKTFDFFNKKNGVAISVKTVDTRTDRLRTNPKEIGRQIREYIDTTLDFEEYKLSGTSLTKDMIKGRKLELGIPTETTPIQRQHILEAIEYGKSSGVEVIITEIEY